MDIIPLSYPSVTKHSQKWIRGCGHDYENKHLNAIKAEKMLSSNALMSSIGNLVTLIGKPINPWYYLDMIK